MGFIYTHEMINIITKGNAGYCMEMSEE